MSFLKRRDRIVVFRLTDDEYQNLRTSCESRGARNLSDFARTELMTSLEEHRQTLQGRLSEVDQKLSSLHSVVQRMEKLLESLARRGAGGRR